LLNRKCDFTIRQNGYEKLICYNVNNQVPTIANILKISSIFDYIFKVTLTFFFGSMAA